MNTFAIEIAQLTASIVTSVIAVFGALYLAIFQRRERIGAVISYGYGPDVSGSPEDTCYLSVHNISQHKIAVAEVRYVSGFFKKPKVHGTAIYYLDPFDLSFPYEVGIGDIRNLRLEESSAQRTVALLKAHERFLCWFLRRPRIWVEFKTSIGTRRRISGEKVLPWKEQASWAR